MACPLMGWSTGTTAASAHLWLWHSAPSTSAVPIRCPLTLITSSTRPACAQHAPPFALGWMDVVSPSSLHVGRARGAPSVALRKLQRMQRHLRGAACTRANVLGTDEPVVAVGVAAAAIAGEVVAGVDAEVDRLEARVVAAQRAHAARPRLLDHQVPAAAQRSPAAWPQFSCYLTRSTQTCCRLLTTTTPSGPRASGGMHHCCPLPGGPYRGTEVRSGALLPHPSASPCSSSPLSFRMAGSTPKKGSVALEGFSVVAPGSGVIMCAPVSVCHQVSTMGQRPPPTTCRQQG